LELLLQIFECVIGLVFLTEFFYKSFQLVCVLFFRHFFHRHADSLPSVLLYDLIKLSHSMLDNHTDVLLFLHALMTLLWLNLVDGCVELLITGL